MMAKVLYNGISRDMTPEEQAEYDGFMAEKEAPEFKLSKLRRRRDALLQATDVWALQDRTMTAEQTAYRQALRDITNTYTSLDDVVWPEEPV